jgi:hypothetical protein
MDNAIKRLSKMFPVVIFTNGIVSDIYHRTNSKISNVIKFKNKTSMFILFMHEIKHGRIKKIYLRLS